MSERCETCRFWHTQDGTFPVGQPPGRCRREHPYGTPCGSADWCGEWKAKDEPPDGLQDGGWYEIQLGGFTPPPPRLARWREYGHAFYDGDGKRIQLCSLTGYKWLAGPHGPAPSLPEPTKPKSREPGWYWVRCSDEDEEDGLGPWVLAFWEGNKPWNHQGKLIVPSEIDERRIVRGG